VGEIRSAYKIFVGKGDGKKLLVTPILRWGSNVRIDLEGEMWNGFIWLRTWTCSGFFLAR